MPKSACQLHFGNDQMCTFSIAPERILAHHVPPDTIEDFDRVLAEVIRAPIDFPGLDRSVFPGDQVVLVLDRDTPQADRLIGGIVAVLNGCRVGLENVTILQPADLSGRPLRDPRQSLPRAAREQIGWQVHDPTDAGTCAYLSATASGQSLYLSRVLTEADVAICVGVLTYDPLLGYRGTSSSIYPGLAQVEDIRQAHGQSHDELTFDDSRPLRQAVDEAAWLLGLQFVVQVIPGIGDNVAAVLAGQIDSVLKQGKQAIAEYWKLNVPSRPELVVASISADASGHGWSQIGAALDASRRIVAQGGRVVLLTEVAEEPGDGVQLIRDSQSPRDALQPIRAAGPPDLRAATQIAKALDWANVYLLSRQDANVVEDLYMLPLADTTEAKRVIDDDESCVVIAEAHRVAASVNE